MSQDLLDACRAAPSLFSPYEQEQTRVSVGSAGKVAVARMSFEKFGEKTHLTDLYTQIPAKVLRALYYDPHRPGLPYIIFVNPTGGIVQGDRYEYEFHLAEGAEVFITDSMATKIYKMDLNCGSRQTEIHLGAGCRLEYLPRETIAFADSRWFQNLTIHVSDGSKLLYSEIFCPGRIAMGEFWDFSVFASKLMIEKDGTPLLVDSVLYRKSDKENAGILFGKRSFLLNAYWYSEDLPEIRHLIDFGSIFGGVSDMPYDRGVVVKALSDNLDELKQFQLRLWAIFRKVETGAEVPSLRIY